MSEIGTRRLSLSSLDLRPIRRVDWRAVVLASVLLSTTATPEAPALSSGGLMQAERARVIRVIDPKALKGFEADSQTVRQMVHKGMLAFTGKSDPASAWQEHFTSQDRIGIKVVSGPGKTSGTRVAVVEAVVQELLAAGFSRTQVIVWDKHIADLRQAGYFALAERLGVRVAGASEARYDEDASYESNTIGKLIWNDHEFGKTGENVGKRSFVSKLVTRDMTKIILISPLLNHNEIGVSGQFASLVLGSVDNTLRFESDPGKMAVVLPEMFAMEALGDKVAFCIVDALICQYQGEQTSLLHYSSRLNQVWFSKDPVALDVLSIREIEKQRQTAKVPSPRLNWDLYQNAQLLQLGINDPRSIQILDAGP